MEDGQWGGEIRLDQALSVFGLNRQDLSHLVLSDIERRYRQVALKVHPDRGGNETLFQTVNDCFRIVARAVSAKTAHYYTSPPPPPAPVSPDDEYGGYGCSGVSSAGVALPPRQHPVGDRGDYGSLMPRVADPSQDADAFNRVFEKHRARNEEVDTGYGEWLSSAAAAGPPEPPPPPPELTHCMRGDPAEASQAFNAVFDRTVRQLPPERLAIIVRPTAAGAGPGGLCFSSLDPEGVDDYTVGLVGGLVASDCRIAHSTERLASNSWERADSGARLPPDALVRLASERRASIASAQMGAREQERERAVRSEERVAAAVSHIHASFR